MTLALSPVRRRGLLHRHIELHRIDDGLYHLLFERFDTSVPEERPAVAAIDDGGNVTRASPAEHADRRGWVAREGPSRIVAGGAGERPIAREARVVEQLLPELDALRGQRVFLRDRQIEVQAQRNCNRPRRLSSQQGRRQHERDEKSTCHQP
jgi:hypothetical protein